MLLSAAQLVASYLRANGYSETLTTFIREAGLTPDAGTLSNIDVTLEQILEEKRTFDVSTAFEKLGLEDETKRWATPAPANPTVTALLPSASNILHVSVESLSSAHDPALKQCIIATTADRRLNLIQLCPPSFQLLRSYTHLQDSPILDVTVLAGRYLLITSMSGKLILYDASIDRIIEERRDHTKYLVKVATWSSPTATYIVTAGWDAKLSFYHLSSTSDRNFQLGGPVATLTLPSVPETALFIQSQDKASSAILLLTRRDSSYLYYYAPPTTEAPGITLIGKQNLAPHSNAWVAFTPSAVEICPTDPSIVAIATSSVPHMKLLIVRLLIPPIQRGSIGDPTNIPEPKQLSPTREEELPESANASQASQARAALVLQDREEAAILIQCSTLSPQTQYSTPKLAWRPDGSGVWVNSDDGIVRGVEASTGKIIASLEGHEAGSKIRCLWAGWLATGSEHEVSAGRGVEYLISGGFDQRLIIWNAK